MDFENVRPRAGVGHGSFLTLVAVTSPVMASVSGGYNPNDPNPTHGTLASKGLVMLFQVVPVPGPSAVAICGLGVAGLAWHSYRKNRGHTARWAGNRRRLSRGRGSK